MDLYEAIQQLYAEKERLERVIASLEELQRGAEELQRGAGAIPALTQGIKRRGRKFMNPEERQEVSARMKKYWATRRKEPQKGG
jgi:hypothetical protein